MRFGKGPRITDEEFFRALDLDRPGLEDVRDAAQAGDWKTAQEAFAVYIRRRERPIWFFDWRARLASPDLSYDTSAADRIARNELTSVSVPYDFGPEGEIDWELNPINYREWTWQLSRHPFWVTLGETYWATGDERYAQAFVRQMTHWVRNVPRPDDSGNPWREDRTNCWRTIECGIRMGRTWFPAFYRFLSSPSFSAEAICTMVKSMVEHARHLLQWPQSGNWLAMEANGLYHVGVMFPEFHESETWRRVAMERLYRELDAQVYPDGAQIELSSGYHQVSLRNFVWALEVGRLNGQDIPTDYVSKLERMYHYDLYMAMPDGRMPALNDGGWTEIHPLMVEAIKYFPAREDFRWAATKGQEGTPPRYDSYCFPYAGHLVMRSGWEKDARYLFFDAGPFGYGHQHEDKLNIVLYAYGKVLVTDAGNYPYDSSEWRRYVLSTRAHNTIRVDGQDQRQQGKPRQQYVVETPLPHTWINTDAFDYASAGYWEGYGPQFSARWPIPAEEADRAVTHYRKILFVKPDFWIVTDFLLAADDAEHEAESLFHLDVPAAEAHGHVVRSIDAEGPNLAIHVAGLTPLRTEIVCGQTEPEVQGWIPRGGPYECQPIPTAVFRTRWKGITALTYVLYPLAPEERDPVISLEKIEVNSDASTTICPAIGFRLSLANGRAFLYAQRHGKTGVMRWQDALTGSAYESIGEIALIDLQGGEARRFMA